MPKAIWLAGAAACALAGPALAQETPPEGTPVAQQGVLVFEPAFFADAQPDTARDMIDRLPGFAFDSGDSGTRGLAGASGNVLIDGRRPSTKSDGLDDVLERISAASVARIELIRGGAPGIDMQGRSVVANVVLIRAVTIERVLEADAYIYSDGYIGPVLSGRWSRREGDDQIEGTISAFIDRTEGTSDGYRRRFDPSGGLIQDADLILRDRIRNVRATGAVQRGLAGGLVRVNGLVSWFGREDTQDLLIRSGAGVDSFNKESSDEINGELGINWTRDLGPRTGLDLIGLQRWSTEDYTGVSESGGDSSTFIADSSSGESIGRAVLRFRPNDRWAFETGGEVAYNFLDSANAFADNGVAIPVPSSSVKVEELRGEIFGQATWRLDPTLTLEGGLRVEVSEISQSGDSDLSKSFVYPKPRLQATWTPAAGHQVRVRLEREVGQLDFGDFVASADIDLGQVEGGNPDLEPQKVTVLEAIYERRFWDEGALELTGSYAEYEDVVDLIPLSGGFDGVGNIGDGTAASFQVQLTLPTDRLGVPNGRLQARGSWSDTSVTDPVTREERRFRGNQAFGCGIDFNQDLRGGRWSWGFEHDCNTDRGRSFRVREVRTSYTEPELELYGQWKPQPELTVRVELNNLTRRERGSDREIYSGPRNIAPLAFREVRRTSRDPFVFIQVRRTL
ncbi:hypothetical protein IP78_03430 [Brevundimonas sp. AAP58]|uniref:TonB-dependent receptor plug domain-containing protein n=1 Tax=Brevundimonas sp. AAP58 TaxID=1523422 RepID=UPI0006B8A631|nr:TonB-dependent receptor [Brevundimonas sp. AAP58]KPF82924.1 hypothetical protein IP78_03430 [Brevundimonas sp. AAP58]